MIEAVLIALSSIVLNIISSLGYWGLFILMTLESAAIPAPSEIILPFSGFLSSAGRFNLWLAILVATLGNVVGSIILYLIGKWGKDLITRYKKIFQFFLPDLEKMNRWFSEKGEITIILGRNLPWVRTFISLPAGMAEMPFYKFVLYTFFGSIPWNAGLIYLGFVLGKNWEILGVYFRKFDFLIAIILILGLVWWFWKHFKSIKR